MDFLLNPDTRAGALANLSLTVVLGISLSLCGLEMAERSTAKLSILFRVIPAIAALAMTGFTAWNLAPLIFGTA